MTPALGRALLATGFIALLGQIMLLRELSVAFYGVELIYVLALGVWLLGSGLGAALGLRRRGAETCGLAFLFACWAALLPAAVAFLRAARRLLGGTPGAYLPFSQGLLALLLAVVPVAFLSGLLFARVAQAAVARGASFARAYALESLGGLASGLVATLLLALGARAAVLLLPCALVALAAAAPFARSRSRPVRGLVALLGLVIVAGVFWAGPLDRASARWNHPSLVETRDSPYARLAVARAFGQVSFFANDALTFESESVEEESFVHPVLLEHAAPSRLAILGGAASGLVQEALKHHPSTIDAVELDPAALDLAFRFLPEEQTRSLTASGVRLAGFDPRVFLSRAGPYDAILVGMPDPDSGLTNRFYTREFFRECARRLGPKGVLGLRLRSAENLWTPLLARRMASIQRALTAEFQDVLWLPGSVNVVVASQHALERDPEVLARRLAERHLACRLVSRPYLGYLMTNARGGEIAELLRNTRAPANSDARPVCYTYAAALWLSKFFPRLGFADMPWPDQPRRPALGLLAFAGLALVLAFSRLWSQLRRAALAFVAGVSGMVAESVLVLHYQARWGALFQDVGLLLSAFMAGLTLGAWLLGCWARAGQGSRVWRLVRGLSLLALLAGFNLGLAHGLTAGLPGGRAGVAVLLLLAGAMVGALLAHASHGEADQARLVSPLYAADLLGGCLGALLGGLLAIPLLGLTETSLALAALALAALVLA